MSTNLFVGNLVWTATTDDLYQLFQVHGAVRHAQVVMDRATGRSKGFGFVEMAHEADALGAIAALHGRDYRGRNLTVSTAQPARATARSADRPFAVATETPEA